MKRFFLAVVMFGMLVSCADTTSEPQASPPPDQSGPALVAMAHSYHETADLALEQNDLKGAKAAMQSLIQDLDSYQSPLDETLNLQLDAHARLARLTLNEGDAEAALKVADEGLAKAGNYANSSIFGGYLQQIRGDALRAQGNPAGAVEAHAQAIRIFKALLEKTQENPQGSTP